MLHIREAMGLIESALVFLCEYIGVLCLKFAWIQLSPFLQKSG